MYEDIEEIRAANEAAGQLWFSPSTMAWWGCTVDDTIYPVGDGAYFVSRDENPVGAHRFTVRFCDAYGHVSTPGEFLAWGERADAHRDALKRAMNH